MDQLKGVRVILGVDPGVSLGEVENALKLCGARVERVGTVEQLRKALREERGDVVLVHLNGQGGPFGELMKHPELMRGWPPVVALTFTEEAYLPAMHAGVFDCLVLPIDEDELERIVTLALESRQIQLPVSMQP